MTNPSQASKHLDPPQKKNKKKTNKQKKKQTRPKWRRKLFLWGFPNIHNGILQGHHDHCSDLPFGDSTRPISFRHSEPRSAVSWVIASANIRTMTMTILIEAMTMKISLEAVTMMMENSVLARVVRWRGLAWTLDRQQGGRAQGVSGISVNNALVNSACFHWLKHNYKIYFAFLGLICEIVL